jgi:hypothetical protein
MTVTVISADSAEVSVGGLWEVAVTVRDPDGALTSTVPDLTVTPPDGTPDAPVAMTQVAAGVFRTLVTIDAAGRWVARADADGAVADVAAWAASPTPGTGMVVLADLTGAGGYLRNTSFTDAEVQDALDAEAQAQRDCCTIPAVYPASLREALLRRVQRNLAMRSLPLAYQQGDAEGGDTVLPGWDIEIKRYERRYPKVTIG